jgi:hypothetical protein
MLKKRRCFSQKRKRVGDMGEKEIGVEKRVSSSWEEKYESWGKIENYENEMVGFGDESEKVWAEFYQIGQWGFGRVSFSKQTH